MKKKYILSVVLIAAVAIICGFIAEKSRGSRAPQNSTPLAVSGDNFHDPFAHESAQRAREKVSVDVVSQQDSPTLAPERGDEINLELSREISDFLSPKTQIPFLRASVQERLRSSDLPQLYLVLENDSYAKSWSNVLFAICVLEDDERALQFVTEFVATPWDWRISPYEGREAARIIRSIIRSIATLAMLEPTVSGPSLKRFFSQYGAEEHLSRWRDAPHPDSDYKDAIVGDFMHSAASGLLHTREPELIRVVEEEFYSLYTKTNRNVAEWERMTVCEQVMGEYKIYQEMGWDKGIRFVHGLESEQKLNFILSRMSRFVAEANAKLDRE